MEEILEIKHNELGGRYIDGARKVVQVRQEKLSGLKAGIAKKLLSVQGAVRIGAMAAVLFTAGCGNASLPKAELPFGLGRGGQTQGITTEATPHPVATASPPDKDRLTATATTTPKPLPSPSPTRVPETPTLSMSEYRIGELVLSLDAEGIPVNYRTKDGKQVSFDRKELERVRQQAVANKEPEVFTVISAPETKQKSSQFLGSKEHPLQKELPADVLSEVELRKRGVEIMQADHTQLFIRKNAFDPDGPLADYANGKHRLEIVLLNASLVSDYYMQDPKYNRIKAAYLGTGSLFEKQETKIDVAKYRQQRLQAFQQLLESYHLEQQSSSSQSPSRDSDSITMSIKVQMFEYQHASDEEILLEASNHVSKEAGIFTLGTSADGKPESLIIIAVGASKPAPAKIAIISDSKGKINFIQTLALEGLGYEPQANQTHPDPASFTLNQKASHENGDYPYGGQSPGGLLRHEIEHDTLIEGPRRKIRQEDFKNPDGSPDVRGYFSALAATIREENYNEYDTDMGAMGEIQKAHQRWVGSGYKDDSGYCFVFRLPGGGYILTQNKSGGALRI